jgi:SAM-dependent methyltransferase
MRDKRLLSNRAMWDANAAVHAQGSATYPVWRLRAGKPAGMVPPPDNLGPVRGKSLLHLQCHIGTDSLDWSARGAKVTAVDFSPRALKEARALSLASGIPARFVESNVYDLPRTLKGKFDIVLTYHGILCWLPDLTRWARVVAHFLKPNGIFYIADGHPLMQSLDYLGAKGNPRLARSYFPGKVTRYRTGGGTYANPKATTPRGTGYEWQHSLGEIVGALQGAGLRIEYLHEYPFLFFDLGAWTRHRFMRQDRKGFWHLKTGDRIPLMFSIKARHTR